MSMPNTPALLPMASAPCACCAPAGAVPAQLEASSSTTAFGVTGMTCSHCVASVMEEITSVEGVVDVAVDLVVGGTSRLHVSSDRPLSEDVVRSAIAEAGYVLAPLP
jgi:copper chaperone